GRLQHVHEQGSAAWPAVHAHDHLDRRGARPRHVGRLSVLHRQGRRDRHVGVRQDGQGTRGERQEVPQAVTRAASGSLPVPADFAAPPSGADLQRWSEADRAARPARIERVRTRFADAGIDAYFGVRREHMRYLTGLAFGEGEEYGAGASETFIWGGVSLPVLAHPRYTIQVRREAPDAQVAEVY